jgi:predicted heme/steroid binding protein
LYFVSGYGLTKGIIDRQLSLTLHQTVLPFITFTAFIVHSSISISYAFIRWRIWNILTKSLATITFGIIYLLFLYFAVKNLLPSNVNNSGLIISQPVQKTFTTQELLKYNGKDGNSAYVAVDGIVYDLSSVFINGTHFGYSAGQDLTAIFYTKHVNSQITKYPVVGILK